MIAGVEAIASATEQQENEKEDEQVHGVGGLFLCGIDFRFLRSSLGVGFLFVGIELRLSGDLAGFDVGLVLGFPQIPQPPKFTWLAVPVALMLCTPSGTKLNNFPEW